MPLNDETHIVIAQYIGERERNRERIRPSELFEMLDESSAEFNAILDLNYGDKLSGETAERFFEDSVRTLRIEDIERQIAVENEEYAKETDVEKRKEISRKLSELIQKRNQLKRRK